MNEYVSAMVDNLGSIVLAIGALGTAAFGVIEGFKWTFIGLSGYRTLTRMLGEPFMAAMRNAYGEHVDSLLKAQYRSSRASGDLARTLRQGIRAGLREANAQALARSVGESVVSAADLEQVAIALAAGADIDGNELRKLGRFELAVDMRIDAAITAADVKYVGAIRCWASAFALVLAAVVGFLALGLKGWAGLGAVLIVGIAAVPVAPIAKDLVGALTSAANALSRVRNRS